MDKSKENAYGQGAVVEVPPGGHTLKQQSLVAVDVVALDRVGSQGALPMRKTTRKSNTMSLESAMKTHTH